MAMTMATKRISKAPPTPTRSSRLIKVLVVLVVLAVFGFLFLSTVRESRAKPHTDARRYLSNWSLVVEPPGGPRAPLLVLRPPPELPSGLFHQVFLRAMESLGGPP